MELFDVIVLVKAVVSYKETYFSQEDSHMQICLHNVQRIKGRLRFCSVEFHQYTMQPAASE